MILVLGAVFGFLLARKVLSEPCLWLALFVAPLLGIFVTLLSGGLLLQYLPWTPWNWLTAAALGAGIWWLKGRPSPPADFRWPRPWLWAFLALAIAAVLLFCWFHQAVGMVVDGDFFIHGANVGLFARGYLPPVNPFLGVPMHGHYGRDLAIAIFARDTSLGFLTAEWVLTTGWQVLSFLVLFFWLRREFDSDLAGALGAGFAFFGMNFSSYAGLAELLANNNPLAFCLLIVIGWAVFRAQHLGPSAWLVAGLLLGLDAIIYETHFGVLGLALSVMFKRPRAVLAIGLLALFTGILLSGVVRSTARGAPESGSEQTIRMRIFKKQIFCLRTDNLRPSRAFETKARPWAADFTPSSRYAAIWSRSLLNTFWYPVWLLPMSTLFLAWYAYRKEGGSEAGLWWATIAWLSLLTPALADFGFFEAETARWLVVTALGAAVALGVTLAILCRRAPLSGISTTILLVAMCSVGFQQAVTDMAHAYRHPGTMLPVGRPGLPPGSGLLPDPELALLYHYGISADVLKAASWIRAHSSPGEHFICDSFDLPANARGALIGQVGLLPAMEAVPPVWSRSVNSYQTNLQQRGFWATGDLERLDPKVDWLLVSRGQESFGTANFEAGSVRAYRVESVPPLGPPGAGEFGLEFARQGALGSVLSVKYQGPLGCLLQLRFEPLGEQEFVADQNIQSVTSAPRIDFVVPYAAGEYQVQGRLSPDAPWRDFGTFSALEP